MGHLSASHLALAPIQAICAKQLDRHECREVVKPTDDRCQPKGTSRAVELATRSTKQVGLRLKSRRGKSTRADVPTIREDDSGQEKACRSHVRDVTQRRWPRWAASVR